MALFERQSAVQAATEAERTARADELLPLVRATMAGDPEAAATLITQVGSSMMNVVRRVVGRGSPDVDDVAQDAVIALLGSLATFRGDCSVLHFSNRVALLTALAARRRMRLRQNFSDDGAVSNARDSGLSPLETTLAGRRRTLVRAILDELPEVIAEALALHFVLGYTVDEIAAAAAISPNTIWSRLRLGKQALRRKLDRDDLLAELREEGNA